MNQQRGSIILYGVIALFAVTLAGGAVYTYTHAIERAEKAEADRDVWKQSAEARAEKIETLKTEIVKKDKLLAARQAARNTAEELERRINDALNKAAATDPKAREWAVVPVPSSIVDGLRVDAGPPRTGGKDGAVPPSAKPPAASPGG